MHPDTPLSRSSRSALETDGDLSSNAEIDSDVASALLAAARPSFVVHPFLLRVRQCIRTAQGCNYVVVAVKALSAPCLPVALLLFRYFPLHCALGHGVAPPRSMPLHPASVPT